MKTAIWTTSKRKSTCKMCFYDTLVFPYYTELTKFTLGLNREQSCYTALQLHSKGSKFTNLQQNSN